MEANGSGNGRRRVVITGIGAVTPLGNDIETTWTNLISGRSGAGPITQFDATGYPVTFAAEVKDFDPTDWIDRKQTRRMDRFAHLVVAAARQAENDSGLDLSKDADRVGASVATGIGGLKSFQDCHTDLVQRGADRVSPFSIPEIIPNMGAAWVSEELEHAKARGAKIYGELIGYGVSSDANHITEPDPVGTNPARALQMAFDDAGITGDEVDYINAHATSTPIGDAAETRMIKLALGEDVARKVPISSTKGATGHCLGAAGAVEAIFSLLAIRDGVLPPTINLETPDPNCDLDYVPNEARRAEVRTAVSNSFGFGGHNASIVLRRYED